MPATTIDAPPGGSLGTVAGDPYATPVESRGKSGGFGRRWSELTPEQQQKVKDGFQKAWGYVPNDLDNPKASYFETEYDPKPLPADYYSSDPRFAGKVNYHNVNYKINGLPEYFWTEPESLKPGTGLSNSLETPEEWNKRLMTPSPNTRSLVVSPQEQSKYLLNPGTYQGPTNYSIPEGQRLPGSEGPTDQSPFWQALHKLGGFPANATQEQQRAIIDQAMKMIGADTSVPTNPNVGPRIDYSQGPENPINTVGQSPVSGPATPAIPNPYLPPPTGNPTTPATTANPPAVNIDNAPVNPTTNLSGGISPQGQYNPAGGTFVNPSSASSSKRRRSANNYFNRNWFGGNIV